ncbi:MAG: phospholipase D-like domain-containing protein [Bacteroidia bacterium]
MDKNRAKGSKYRQKQYRPQGQKPDKKSNPQIIRPKQLSDKEMARRFDSEFGDRFTLNYLQKIAFPYYKVKLSLISAGKPEKDTSQVHSILLRLIQAGMNTENEIKTFLGLQPPYFILRELYELARHGAIYLGKEGAYWLNTKGEEILNGNAWISITETVDYELVIDGTTGEIQFSREFQNIRVETKFTGIFDGNRPEFKWLNEHWVDICQVYQMENKGKELVDFAKNKQSILWGDLFYEEHFVLGYTEKDNPSGEIYWKVLTSSEKELKDKVKIVKERLGDQPNAFYDEDIAKLALKHQSEFEKERQEVNKEKTGAGKKGYRELVNFEIREAVLNAIRNAKKAILIESPWIRKATERLFPDLEQALERGVKVCILYGIDGRNDHHEEVILKLRDLKSKYGQQFYFVNLPDHFNNNMIELSGTHRKILIKDDELTIKGSFNYLSNNAEMNEKFAAEEATVFFQGSRERWEEIFREYGLAENWLSF